MYIENIIYVRNPSRTHSDAHYMEEHRWGCFDINPSLTDFNARGPKSFFRTDGVVLVDSHHALNCLPRGDEYKKCWQQGPGKEVALFHHYR